MPAGASSASAATCVEAGTGNYGAAETAPVATSYTSPMDTGVMDESASARKQPCATCLLWRVALAVTLLALLIGWLSA
jgi:hypothetical protein